MNESRPDKPRIRRARRAVCLLWMLGVTAAYAAVYCRALMEFAHGAAARFPGIARLLELFRLGS